MMTVAMLMVAGMFGLLTLSAQQAQAKTLECGVLPQSMCNKAKSDPINTVINGAPSDPKDTAIWDLLKFVVKLMTGGVAILAVAGIIYGAVLYISAGPNQEQVKKAKSTFTNVVIGVLVFALMFSLLQWLIPGGVF